jgi:hypothetical protein
MSMTLRLPILRPPEGPFPGRNDTPRAVDWVEEVTPKAPEVMPRALKVGLVAAMVSLILLTRFGVNTGAYGLNFGVPILYVLIFAGLWKYRVHLDLPGLLLFVFFMTAGALSLLVNMNLPYDAGGSPASLILLAALYLPFVFVLKPFPQSREAWLWTMRAFSNIAAFVAVTGIVQFCMQFVWHPPWLFDFSPLIPKAISVDILFNSEISTGSAFKSNGFFLREPSAFSFLMAFSLICEMALFKRWSRMVLFATGLLLSYSGTGLLALAFGLMFPFGFKTAVRIGVIAVVGLIVFVLFGDALNLSFTLSRVGEFSAEHSSGDIRYVAPMRLVSELIDSDTWTALLGHGPGTIFHAVRSYEFHDPTWAKLVYEYGLIGFAGCLMLMLYAMSRSHAPVQIRATLFFCWLIQGGHLLTPENVLLIYVLLAIWPSPGSEHRRAFAGSTMPMTTPFDDERSRE